LQAAEITAIAYRVQDLSAEVRRVEQENSVLAVEIAELERLDRVESRAEALGFTPAQSVHYLRLPAAQASDTPADTPQR
jgi:cell division protein FtsL